MCQLFQIQIIFNLPADYYDKSSIFDQCYPNSTANNGTNAIYISDYLPEEQVHWLYWVWILIVLNLVQLVLRRLDSKGRITFITKIFGPSVPLQIYLRGPILSEDQIH